MMKIVLCLLLTLLIGAAGYSRPAQAGLVGDSLQELGASKQVQEAGDALQNAFIAVATKGEGTRGADGALAELATNSGELICNAWIISFRVHIRNMIIENVNLSGDAQIQHQQLIQQAQRFADQLEQECTRVGLIGDTPGGAASGGGGGEEEDEMLPEPEVVDHSIQRRPGETVADAICRLRCQRYLDRLEEQQQWLSDLEARERAAQQDLAQKQARTEELLAEARTLQNELDALERITSVAYNGNWSAARKSQWRNAQTQRGVTGARLETKLEEVEQAAAAEEAARTHLESVQSSLVYQRRGVEQAQRAYDDCLRRCLTQAADAGDPTNTVCPEPAAHKSVSVGPNDKVGSRARLGTDIKKSLGGGASLGGLLGGGGGTFGSKKANPVPNRAGSGGSKEPETADDPIRDRDKVAQAVGDTELEVGAMLVGDGLLVSSRIEDAPGDGTFQAVFLEDAQGRRMTPDRYDIYDLWREWSLTVWWTYDRWVDGQHVEHQEGGWSESGRETMQLAALRPGAAAENGIWSRLGFSSATKGVRTLGTHFALTPQDLAQPVDLVIHTTLPEEDPVTTQPAVYRLTLENGSKVKLEPATATLALARDCY